MIDLERPDIAGAGQKPDQPFHRLDGGEQVRQIITGGNVKTALNAVEAENGQDRANV